MGVRGVHHLPAASFSRVILTHPRGVSRGKCCDCKKSAKSVLDLENTRVCGRLQGLDRPINVAFASWPSPVRPGLVDGSASRGDDATRGAFAAVRSGADGEGNQQRHGAVIAYLTLATAQRRCVAAGSAPELAMIAGRPFDAPGWRFWATISQNRLRASLSSWAWLAAIWVAQFGCMTTSRLMSETNCPASRTWSSSSRSITGLNVRARVFHPLESTFTKASTS